MQIDSGLNGYPYPTRPHMIERVAKEPAQREAEEPRRSGSTLTGADTFLSSSLAAALWDLGGSQGPNAAEAESAAPEVEIAAMPVDWVAELYREFSESR